MKRLFVFLFVSLFVCLCGAADVRQKTDASFDFSRMPLNAFVQLVLSDATDFQYVIDPEVLLDVREVSVRVKGSTPVDLRVMLSAVIKPLGYSVVQDGVFVRVSKSAELVKVVTPEDEKELVVYRPRFRPVQYLLDLTSMLYSSSQVTKRAVPNPTGIATDNAPPGTAAAAFDRQSDVVALFLTAKQAFSFQKAMLVLDVATPEIFVQATLYEVSVSKHDASALSLAAKLFSGKFEINFSGPQLANNLRLNLPGLGIDAFVSALQSDSRFKVVSNPRLRVKDGSTARLVVGSDVPVLGAVSYPGNGGAAVRSVEYKTSGSIFEISPHIRSDVVELKIQQSLSSFYATTTGVNDSPTLMRRDLTSSVSAKPGELIILGGLVDSKNDAGEAHLPFLPDWMGSKSSSDSRTELMLVMSVTSI